MFPKAFRRAIDASSIDAPRLNDFNLKGFLILLCVDLLG